MTSASLNSLVSRLSPPPIPAVQAWGRAYDGALGPLIDLSQAVPGYPPHPDMLEWLGDAASSATFSNYGPIEGEEALRRAYAAHVGEIYGADLSPANIHITSGCNQAFVCAALATAAAGEKILLTDPFYFNHETTLAMFGIDVGHVTCRAEDGFVPTVDAVASAMDDKVRALALVTPNNPTGAIYPPERLLEIFDYCRSRGIWLILDETYRDFLPVGAGQPHDLFARPDWQHSLIQLYSFSKSYCIPGHRLGAITAGSEVVSAIAKIMDNLQICPPRAAQDAVAKAIPALTDWREENRVEIERRAQALRETMSGLKGWHLEAVGAYFAFIRHPFDGKNSVEVAERLAKEAGILAIPGEYFGEGQSQFLRFAFANADSRTIRLLRDRMERFGSSS
ncbi:aminotransferase [Phyllobacterium sp. 0TCS1.6C]|uniref:aminotransferase n=1 Tax=unclassified Phyllobacterium TaxID=2638441 RepID=UPI0022641F1C|nr:MULTISPECIES: aminotransferase [unclassified Phyllobacterium]MCX8279763.1 aminotransferase [Phyllobacterium sp. 0TCS1.6C]MCX8295633.1 aminotransferase [Phyllobacterium sp. 0TCS1.6A]